jgi:adenine-specific DNA-methyltransferase
MGAAGEGLAWAFEPFVVEAIGMLTPAGMQTISIHMASLDLACFDSVVRSIGTPVFRAPGVALYGMDCMEGMRRIPDDSIHLCVTSPPYNIGKEYEEPRDLDEYVLWSEEWIRQVHRTVRHNGAFWLNLGYVAKAGRARAIPLPYLLWERVPFFLIQEVVWHYGAGVATRHSFSPRNEKFLWYVKDEREYTFNLDAVRDPDVKYPHQKKNGKLKCNPLGKNPSDVWSIPKVTSGTDRASEERTEHPAQFPVAVIERIVKACSNAGEIVLDPFLGSGTTAEVALDLGRPVLGFEVSNRYLELATDRITTFLRRREGRLAQQALFEGVES